MASTFTPNLGLELQASGEHSGTWGIVLNTDLTDIDDAFGGILAKTAAGTDITLSATEALNVYHNITGTLSADINYIFPASKSRFYIIKNGTTGAHTITAKPSGGSGITIEQGTTMMIFVNGSAASTADILNYLTSLTLGTALPTGSGGTGLTSTGAIVSGIIYVIDGGGAPITTGVKGDYSIPFSGTINSVTLQADQSGSIVVDIWKAPWAVSSPPTVANSIVASAPPTLSSAQSSQDTTLTGWTTTISANDMLRFNVNSATTVTRVTLTLKVTKT